LLLAGGIFALTEKCAVVTPAMREESMRNIDLAFFLIAGALVCWRFSSGHFAVTSRCPRPSQPTSAPAGVDCAQVEMAVFGGMAIFLYVVLRCPSEAP
jgi:hypothetical protein